MDQTKQNEESFRHDNNQELTNNKEETRLSNK